MELALRTRIGELLPLRDTTETKGKSLGFEL